MEKNNEGFMKAPYGLKKPIPFLLVITLLESFIQLGLLSKHEDILRNYGKSFFFSLDILMLS
jgi:hypothetical protein